MARDIMTDKTRERIILFMLIVPPCIGFIDSWLAAGTYLVLLYGLDKMLKYAFFPDNRNAD